MARGNLKENVSRGEISVANAAALSGMTAYTIRKHISTGTLQAHTLPAAQSAKTEHRIQYTTFLHFLQTLKIDPRLDLLDE